MKINPIKGFDGTVLEFAKQLWTLNGYNISPLGAKNILLFIRNVEFLPSIIYELVVKRFPMFKLEKKAYSVFKSLMEEETTKGYQTQSTGGMDNITFQDKFYMDKSREANLAPPVKPIEVINLDGDTYSSYRNWKRSAEGSRALPLLNYTSLESMILKLFFQKRVKKNGK
jgi:hypothetical protein